MKHQRKGKYPYTVEADRVIYLIHAPGCEDFFLALYQAPIERLLQKSPSGKTSNNS